MAAAPACRVALGPADVALERRADGAILLRSPHALQPYPENLTARLAHWAGVAPQRKLIAQRDAAGGWRSLDYGQTYARVRAIAQSLLERGLSRERPLAVLSDNDIEHFLLALACLHVGIIYAPVSSAYSLVSTDHARLKYMLALLTPGLVYATDGERYAKAIAAAVPSGTEVLTGERFAELGAATPGPAVDAAHATVGPDTIAKFLLTSGSTGQPKAVIAQTLPSLCEAPPVLVDWLPWNHTAGSDHNTGIVIYNGGTLYIDEGRPEPGLIEHTVRNLREIAPTIYFNVPRGYDALLPYFREDPALRERFFSRLQLLQYAAAVLPQPTWEAYEALAVQTCGERVLWTTDYGATETAPAVMYTGRGAVRAGSLGLPLDGVEMKLTPVDDKLEARFRGPNITPGYWRQPELTAAAFDDEGYYRTGDALRFVDQADPVLGLEFDGRTTEDFKLGTGTWVSAGPLRARIGAACAPYVLDVVITGHNRDALGALVFPNAIVCRGLDGAALRARLQPVFERLWREATGSSTRIARALIMEVPPSIDASEVTDKGSINQRAVLKNRAGLVDRLYAEPVHPDIMVLTK
ncbi:MAG: feruloyl-CoA synthase [Betaproteobacteria bacterium]|nr:feruloyl-CoA synthase [Betaproteobacteria bacterium]